VTRRRRTGRGTTGVKKTSARLKFDPFFACLVFAGVGLGTLALGASSRLVILWTTLLILWLIYRENKSLKVNYRFGEIGRGALIGLAIGAPLVLLAFRALVTAIPILFVSVSQTSMAGVGGTTIFVSLVLLAPLAEELFFRDILQQERGLWLGAGLYAAAGLILFLPTAGQYPAVLIAVVGAWAVLGTMYSFFYERLGFVTTYTCHVMINLILLFVPAVLSHFGFFTR
jgi:membrane protease YdiL (CAAX protease family)